MLESRAENRVILAAIFLCPHGDEEVSVHFFEVQNFLDATTLRTMKFFVDETRKRSQGKHFLSEILSRKSARENGKVHAPEPPPGGSSTRRETMLHH